MKVIILCAGEGERLKPLTNKIPKPLIKINKRPILSYIFDSLGENIKEIYLVIKKENEILFKEFLEKENIKRKVNFLFQKNNKGTFYALLTAKRILKNENKFLVLNGDDIFLKDDIEKIIRLKSPCYGISFKKLDKRYRTCDLNYDRNTIVSFRKQKDKEKNKKIPCFSGALLLNKDFFNYKPVFFENGEAGMPHTLFNNSKIVYFYILREWIQINNTEDLKKAKLLLKD